MRLDETNLLVSINNKNINKMKTIIKIQLSDNFVYCLKNRQRFPNLNMMCNDVLHHIYDNNMYLDTPHLGVPNIQNIIDDYIQNVWDQEYDKEVKAFLALMPKYSDIYSIIKIVEI